MSNNIKKEMKKEFKTTEQDLKGIPPMTKEQLDACEEIRKTYKIPTRRGRRRK